MPFVEGLLGPKAENPVHVGRDTTNVGLLSWHETGPLGMERIIHDQLSAVQLGQTAIMSSSKNATSATR